MKLRTAPPWMPADQYAATLTGLSINLLVKNVPQAVHFQTQVLQAQVVYQDPDFAVLQSADHRCQWMLHADHTYQGTTYAKAALGPDMPRGVGVELRIHHCNPDTACAQASALGYTVLATPENKPHGLREAYIMDADGYVWVPDQPIA